MREPVWIRNDIARAIHLRVLAEHGGASGVRDIGLLESALSRPKHLWSYSDPKPDLAALAASYAFGLVLNHPFVDGNKRVGFVVLHTFLLINGHDLEVMAQEKYETFMSLASGTFDESSLAEWVRVHMKRKKRGKH